MRIKKSVIAAMTIIAAFLVFASPSYYVYASDKQGTDGTEMNAYEAEELEVYLGPDFAGKKFKLETDAGIYPDAVMVGEDGILKLEIGGSKSYKLTVMDDGKDNAAVKSKEQDDAAGVPSSQNADDEKSKALTEESSESEKAAEGNVVTQPPVNDDGKDITEEGKDKGVSVEWTKDEKDNKEFTVLGIPLKHLIIFVVGLIIAIDGLVIINLIQKKRREDYEEEYYYDDEYYDEYEGGYDDEDYDE